MELVEEATDAGMTEVTEGVKIMDKVSADITKENKAMDATITSNKEEA